MTFVTLRKTILTSILSAVFPVILLAQTATIHVRVLDGRTGQSLSGMHLAFVDYYADRDGITHADLNGRTTVTTSPDGDSYIANPDVHGVLVFGGMGNGGDWIPCSRQKFYDSDTRTYGSEHLYSVSTILGSGLVSKNSCSKKTAAAKPGELVIFVATLAVLWFVAMMTIGTIVEVRIFDELMAFLVPAMGLIFWRPGGWCASGAWSMRTPASAWRWWLTPASARAE